MKNIEHQLAEIDHALANYQTQLSTLRVEVYKLELKKEKLKDKIIIQSLKAKTIKERKDRAF